VNDYGPLIEVRADSLDHVALPLDPNPPVLVLLVEFTGIRLHLADIDGRQRVTIR
jgi:hypothetical protein